MCPLNSFIGTLHFRHVTCTPASHQSPPPHGGPVSQLGCLRRRPRPRRAGSAEAPRRVHSFSSARRRARRRRHRRRRSGGSGSSHRRRVWSLALESKRRPFLNARLFLRQDPAPGDQRTIWPTACKSGVIEPPSDNVMTLCQGFDSTRMPVSVLGSWRSSRMLTKRCTAPGKALHHRDHCVHAMLCNHAG
jgi:hypothetical protein